jgi:AraC family transcriptional regulator
VIAALSRLVEFDEEHLAEEIDVAGLANGLGTTEYHVRRMFSSLAGMPSSEYIRRLRMTVAAAEVLDGGELLGIAVRFGYGSTEALGRAFGRCTASSRSTCAETVAPYGRNRSSGSTDRRRSTTMDTRIADRPAFLLVGPATRPRPRPRDTRSTPVDRLRAWSRQSCSTWTV